MKSESQQENQLNFPRGAVPLQPSIIFEDNHLFVVIKPQNLPCCPDESQDDNILDQLKSQHKFVGLVHRLDRVTGGVMVYAKTSKSASRLSEQIKNNEFQKTYLAVLNGVPKNREDTLVDYLYKNEKKNTVEVVPPATTGAKRAELSYEISTKTPKPIGKDSVAPNLSLAEINLVTGRSHQIRVQFSHIGNPIFGDAKYGGDKLGRGWKLALWAYKLSFFHPITQDKMTFIVNPPEETPWTAFDFDRQSHKIK